MGVQAETRLQQRIQRLIKSRGGYVHKNWGNMTSAPGVADLTVCYKGKYLVLEVKEGDNTPSSAQGIHCRNVYRAGGLAAVVWCIEEVDIILNAIDSLDDNKLIRGRIIALGIDDGTRW